MQVVIVGGGFGGVKAALELSKRQIGKIILISDESYFLHHATLYATATGRNYAESVIPLNVIFANHPNVEIVQDFITAIDPQRRLISSGQRDYYYDKLILSLGTVTTHSAIPGLKKHAFGIKSLEDLKEFQDHIHEEVVRRKLDKEYFVIGGGQTGVELAAALTTYLKDLKQMYRLKNTASKVVLVEAGPRLVPNLSKTASKQVAAQLRRLGVKIIKNRKVEALDNDSITIDGKEYATTTALWTSGTVNNPFYKQNAEYFKFAANGRIDVNPYLEALDNVYVIGDNNSIAPRQMALPAMRQAQHVVKNITRLATNRPQLPYRFRSVPIGIPLSDQWGYVEWHGLYVAGRIGAWARRKMELYSYKQLLPKRLARSLWNARSLHHADDDF